MMTLRQWWIEQFGPSPEVEAEPVEPVPVSPTSPAWDYGYREPSPPVLSGMVDGTPTSRKMLVEALSVAQSALTSHPDVRRTEHIGRLQWLIDAIEHDEGDMAWYAAGVRDGRAENPDAARLQQPCVDPETYARIHNDGYALAVAHGLADDPERAEEWMQERIAVALSEARVDLSPFEEVLIEVETRMRAFGGGVQDAYANCSSMLRAALRRYEHPEDPKRH